MEFSFFLSSELPSFVRVKIDSLIGSRQRAKSLAFLKGATLAELDEHSMESDPSGIYVVAQLVSMGRTLAPSQRTPLRPFESHEERVWSEWITFPVRYKDVPRTTQLCFTVHDLKRKDGPPVGGTTLALFNNSGTLRKGKQKLRVFPDTEADIEHPSMTDGRMPKTERDRLAQLDKVMKRFEMNQVPHVTWMDAIVAKQIASMTTQQRKFSNNLFLRIELPTYEYRVIFDEPTVSRPERAAVEPLVLLQDWEASQHDNPIETKYRKLARSRGMASPADWKPNVQEMKQITAIIDYPPTATLKGEEKELLWNYRHSLCSQNRALTKFLKCIDFADEKETEDAITLMNRWAPPEVPDALELLNKHFVNEQVRAYAVSALNAADDRELEDYLPQLVQALFYEKSADSKLARFMIKRGVESPILGNSLHWYLVVAAEEKQYSQQYMEVHQRFLDQLAASSDGKDRVVMLQRQSEFVAALSRMVRELKGMSMSRAKKIEHLRRQVSSTGGSLNELHTFPPLHLPLHPQIQVTGLIAERCSIFKSALSPLNLKFRVDAGETAGAAAEYGIVFKHGDDMRQDQLIIQIISLMDRLLKKERLDLALTPYRVLATSYRDGMSQFIPSRNLSHVLQENKNDIRKYLKGEDADVRPEVLDAFVRSCAGYCVITYILGIGDRHLDNLMVCESGNLFHIDFGYILGKDPKPFPPPMKLCKEMVEAMGGYDSPDYHKFKSFCCEAFNILRKSANLILNLFILMVDANIPDLREEPDKCILKIQERFRLDLDDEMAVQFFQQLINESVKALFPQMFETIHRWAQYWRS